MSGTEQPGHRSVSDAAGLAGLAPAWRELFAAQPAAHLCNSWAYVESTADLKQTGTWRCHLAVDDGELLGALFGVAGSLKPLGLRIPVLSVGTEFGSDPLLRAGHEEPALSRLLAQTLEAERGAALLQFGRLSEPAFRALLGTLDREGYRYAWNHAPYGYAWDTATGSPPLDERLGYSSRQLMRRTERKIARELGATHERIVTTDAATNLAMLDRFAAMEAAGWKGQDGGAIRVRPGSEQQFRAVVASGSPDGLLEWYTLTHAGEPIAIFMGMRTHRTLWLPKIAFDERFADHRPGQELLRRVLLGCLEDPDTDRLDFIGAPPWLDNWRPTRCPYYELRVFNRSLKGAAVAALEVARKATKPRAAQEAMAQADRERRYL